MVGTGALVGMALVALGIVLTPGPNMVYLVSRSVTQGRRAGLVSLLGVAAGFGVYLVAAVAGLATIFVLVPALYTAVKLAGAAYLLWLAWRTLRPGGSSPFTPAPLPLERPRRLFTMGLVTNLLNPKIAIVYVSVLPQFVDPQRGHVAAQSLVLGLTQIAVAVTVNALIVLTAGTLAGFFSGRPLWLRAQRWVMGTVLGALAVRIAADRSRAAVATPDRPDPHDWQEQVFDRLTEGWSEQRRRDFQQAMTDLIDRSYALDAAPASPPERSKGDGGRRGGAA